MELIVTRADNSNYNLPSENSKIVSAVQTRTLMGEDTVVMTVQSVGYINFLIGDWIEVFGRKYTLNTLGEPQRIGENTFEYSLVFEGVNYELTKVVYRSADYSGFNPTSDFPLTGTAEAFLTVLQYNLDRAFGQGVWAIGSFPATEAKTLSFTSENCLLALNRVCSEFGLEYEIKTIGGVKTINLGAVGDTLPLSLEYGKGKGLYSLTRTNVDSKNIVTRLYVEGSDRNVKAGYRDNALRLRIASNAESYIDSPSVASFGVIEGSKIFEDIFPHREGTVSAINASDILEFTDAGMNFDLAEADSNGTKWLIAGQSAKIRFNTGALAGYEFELTSYNHTTKTFKIKPFKDERGLQFPNPDSAAFQIKTGDKYVILDIIMPDSYIQAAEAELLARAQEYLSQNDQPRVEYALELDRFFLKSMFSGPGFEVNFLDAGDYLHIKDSKIGVDKEVRVKTFTRDVLDPWIYQVTLSDVIEPTRIELLLADTLETKKAARQSKLFDPARTRRNWRDVEEVAGMVDTLRAEVALIGSPEGQFQVNSFFEVNKGGNPNSFGATAGVLAHDAFEGDAGSIWNIGAFDVALSNSGAYYLYAQCSRVNTGAVFTVSLTKIGVEDVPGYYHFPVGIISSVKDNARTLTTVYGYTLISGNNISTGIIKNTVSGLEINLGTGEIKGNFKFLSGKTVEQGILDAVNDIQIGGRNLLRNSSFEGTAFYTLATVNGGINTISGEYAYDGSKAWKCVTTGSTNASGGYIQISGLEIGGTYTFSVHVMSLNAAPVEARILTTNWQTVKGKKATLEAGIWQRVSVTFQATADTLRLSVMNGAYEYPTYYIDAIKLEKGNKATDWTPAPEDVTAEITSAKQEALTAASAAQTTANTANTAVGNLSGYVDGAFKDGVIDAAEAKAIEKYKNTLNETMAKAEASYNKVYTNTYLEGTAKTSLLNAKVNLWGQKDTLLSAINTAISGGTTTPAQKTAVDSAFSTFNNLMTAFQNALEEANKAIQVKLDDIAKGYVNDLEIGGTNLLKNTASGVGWSKTDFDAETRTFTRATTSTSESFVALINQTRLENNTTYTLSAWIKSNGQVKDVDYFVYNKSISKVHSKQGIAVTTNWQFVTFTFTTDSSTDYSESTVRFDNNGSKTAGVNAILYVKMPKLEKGSKATDWSPAPEDVPSALDYLATAIQDGSTDVNGGLVATNVMLLKDTNGVVRGGMSGLKEDNVGFWAGGTYQDALDSLAKVLFRKDGSGQLAGGIIKMLVDGDTQIGDIHVDAGGALLIKEGTEDRVILTKSNISTLADIAAAAQNSTATVLAHFDSGVGENTTLLNNAIVVEHNNTKLTVAATLYISISRLQAGAGNGYAGITLKLKQITGGGGETLVASCGEPTENTVQNTYPVNRSFIVPAGTYKLEFSSIRSIGNPEVPFSLECRFQGGTLTAEFDGAKRVTEIGKNGVGVIADANNYSFFGVEGGVYKIVEKTTGVYDRPGVLLAGRMESGAVSKYWGAKYRAGSYREGNNIYRIHHNIGHVDYSVQLTPQSDARMWVIQRATTYCRIQASVATLDFDFAMFGDNK